MPSKRILLVALPVLLLLAAVASYLFSWWAGNRLVTAIEEIDGIQSAEVQRVWINPFSREASLEEVTLLLAENRGSLSAATMRVKDLATGSSFPHRLDVEILGLNTQEAPLPLLSDPALAPLQEWLVKGIRLHMAYRYQPDGHALQIVRAAIEAQGGGRLVVTGALDNIYLEKLLTEENNPLVAALTAAAISISRLEVDYTDAGFVKEMVAERAQQAGMTIPRYAEQLGERMQQALGETDKSPRIDRCLAAMVRFIEKPTRIRLTADSDPSIPIGQFWLSRTRAPFFEKLALRIETLPAGTDKTSAFTDHTSN